MTFANNFALLFSLEAIILAIIVLISQNRADRIADLREEVALQVEEISELEITKVLKLLVVLMEKQGIDLAGDEELRAMLQTVDTELSVPPRSSMILLLPLKTLLRLSLKVQR